MNIAVSNTTGQKITPRQQAHKVAGRLEGMDLDPYQSELNRFLVLLSDAPGEIVDLGRPLRSSRVFKPTTQKRDIEIAHDFEEFAATTDRSDWLFWNIGLPSAKAEVGGLVKANVELNRLINIHFSELRKRLDFELLLLAIHPRWDEFSGRFDLHAHFVCRIPHEHREAARRRLLQAFSKQGIDTDFPVRNAAACATYMIWGVCPYDNIAIMPDNALADLWALSRSRARLVRPCGSFKEFRRSKVAEATTAEASANKARIKANREATAYPRPQPTGADRLLAKIIVKRNGMAVPALLFEEAAITATANQGAASRQDSSTATGIATQEPQETPECPSASFSNLDQDRATAYPAKPARGPLWRRFWQVAENWVQNATAAVRPRIEAAAATARELLGRFISADDPPP